MKLSKMELFLAIWIILTSPLWFMIALVKFTLSFGWDLPIVWEETIIKRWKNK